MMKVSKKVRFRAGVSSLYNKCDLRRASGYTLLADGLDCEQACVREPQARVDSFVPCGAHMMQPEVESLVHE